ncbi:MAG TPA: DNA repair protein RadC [Thermodesulfobacteriota bacterium]|nr:DNA repair protein RadC [Deltaproteobacteria bacterium]HNR12849.1 DNA repair protein RadC [Thermodesulfobacteriota bacterium]HNU72181.1 DNA repair protein RadC [Thermodesulfobacteriota bacterium]HOC38854.1 DNA repair protein RadC [Thermodesulfobacteriota bacterium]
MSSLTDHHDGHRRRLREKFLRCGIAGFHDYEVVELLLTLGTPRRDCKEQAKEAIRKFKSLRGVLEAPSDQLREVAGIGPHNVFGIRLIQEVSQAFLKERLMEKPACNSSQEVFEYLYHSMRGLQNEIFKVLFLDGKNRIIAIEDLFHGTLNASAVYPREVIREAIKRNAVSLVFAHNHPSGDPDPSPEDKAVTRDLIFAGDIMHLKVLDHLIIGDNRYFSFADVGLVEQYHREYRSRIVMPSST